LFLLGICRRYLDESGLPVFVKTDRTIAEKGGTYHLLLLLVVLTADMALSFAALARYGERQEGKEGNGIIAEKLDEYFPDQLSRNGIENLENRRNK